RHSTRYTLSLHDALPIYTARFQQDGDGAEPRTIAAKLRDVVNVRDFGGSPDNPDNLPAFMDAFDAAHEVEYGDGEWLISDTLTIDRKSTRLNSSHVKISY